MSRQDQREQIKPARSLKILLDGKPRSYRDTKSGALTAVVVRAS